MALTSNSKSLSKQRANNFLLVDDEIGVATSLLRALAPSFPNCNFEIAASLHEAIAVLNSREVTAAIVDLHLCKRRGVAAGFHLIKEIGRSHPLCRVIVLTGYAGVEYGVRALNLGASHFLEKPASVEHLKGLMEDCRRQFQLRKSFEALRNQTINAECEYLQFYVGSELWQDIQFAAGTEMPVLLTGESGTGKTTCARTLHRLGGRACETFAHFQPRLSTPEAAACELFGHAEGAFTGAASSRSGVLEEAFGGTIFFDEVDELPPFVQVALLGVLEDRIFRRIGSSGSLSFDSRLISATNRDVAEALENGSIRRDFYDRVAALQIHLPSLRDRLDKISVLAEFALKRARDRYHVQVFELDTSVFERLENYEWPGNLREFNNTIDEAAQRAAFRERKLLTADDLRINAAASGPDRTLQSQVRHFKVSIARSAVARNNGNNARAAEELGIDRSSLRRILNG